MNIIIIWLSKFPCFVPFKFYFMASLFRPTKLFDSIKMNLFKSFREREQMAFQGLSLSVETLIKAFIIGVKRVQCQYKLFIIKSYLEADSFVCTITEHLDISSSGFLATLILPLPKFTEKHCIRHYGPEG